MAKLRYITDEAATTDDFGTHANIATTLLDTIADEDNKPMTIGLEGSWGSGKSTVVNLMFEGIKNGFIKSKTDKDTSENDDKEGSDSQEVNLTKLEIETIHNIETLNSNKTESLEEKSLSNQPKLVKQPVHKSQTEQKCWKSIEYFYIDVWQHEHSCIKRAILHEMIKTLKLKYKYEELDSIESELDGTKTKTSITPFSIILAFGVIVIPIIASFIGQVEFNKVTLSLDDGIHWNLIFGLLSIGIPSFYLIKHYIQSKKDKNQNLIVEQTTTTFSNSSIEFKEYFDQILSMIDKQKKTLIVFDNLDRIDEKKAKEMWAELQVFMQYRNPGDRNKEKQTRPWIIIPYDIEGIRKIWGEGNNDEDNDKVKSFIDKTFNIRLHVPKQITSSWNAYFDKIFDKAPEYIPKVEYQSLEESQKNGDYFDDDNIYSTLKQVIEFNDLNKYDKPPTPREIKDMYNILLIYRDLLCRIKEHEIALEALCFYVYHTVRKSYLSGSGKISVMQYSKNGNKKLSLQRQFPVFLESDYVTHVNAIDYQLSVFATLEKDTHNLIRDYQKQEIDLQNLKKQENDYSQIFWSTFSSYLSSFTELRSIIMFSTVLNDLRKEKPAQLVNIKKCLNHINKMYIGNDDTIACDQVGLDYLELLHEYKVKEKDVNFVNNILDAYGRYITNAWYQVAKSPHLELEIPKYFEVFSLAKKINPHFRISIYYRSHNGLVEALFGSEFDFSSFFEIDQDNYYTLHDDIVYNPSDINQCNISQIVLERLFTETYSKEFVADLTSKVLSILDFAVNKTDQHNNYKEFVKSIWATIELLESEKEYREIFLPFIRDIIHSDIHWELIYKLLQNSEYSAPQYIKKIHESKVIERSEYYDVNDEVYQKVEEMIAYMNTHN